ncbi:hypothetical protein [Ekhidna sp.]
MDSSFNKIERGVPTLITIGLGGLAIVFFLNIKRQIEVEPAEDEEPGFNELLAWTIMPRLLWIATTISTAAILFYTLQLGNDGYLKLLYVGGFVIIISTLVLIVLRVIGTKHLNALFPIYFKPYQLWV